ncbi:hypothetical protein PVAND_011637 [Polypedilum vanderplanki]|uniref:Ras-like protein family member 10B n=1 Tax=Polypedilum vanderplanki TaxID=319348 RepID=A0A9J6CJ78_POLVA|nr:hypothetical protein PVAND_011637 [Polypedilum vanderplanki]
MQNQIIVKIITTAIRKTATRSTLEGDKEAWKPLKVAFLGYSGVGKTQILQQFFKHDFSATHVRTTKPYRYRGCLVCDTVIRELIVLDVPPQKKFPIDNIAEWNHNNSNPLGLRSMHVYVLVFDMGNLDTFQYCRSIREQILSSFTHRNFSIMVVGNKIDLVVDSPTYTQELKDISALVRKHWRSDYVECSAKYNYKLNDVFREIMGISGGCSGTGTGVEFSQSSRHRSKCNIL